MFVFIFIVYLYSVSINNKPDKDDVMRTINERMNSFKRGLRGEENDGDGAGAADHLPAGLVSCITCGKTTPNNHRGRSRDRDRDRDRSHSPLSMSQQKAASLYEDKFSLTLSDDSLSREDYEQMLSVLRGEAGLRSLSRQSTPLKQKPNSYLKKSNSNDLEPLYRRAK